MTARNAATAWHSFAVSVTIPQWLPMIAIVIVAVALRNFEFANVDVSWFLTIAEKWLDGQRLYVDIVDVNPPASMFLYVVPALLARLSGLPAEFTVDALVFVSVGLSLWLAARILLDMKLLAPAQVWPVAALAAIALLIIPAHTFGQREHLALIVFLPALAVSAVRANGSTPKWPMVVGAGLCVGITMIIKPQFATAQLCTVIAGAFCVRSWRIVIAAENWIAAAVLAAYALMVLMVYPRFFTDVLPHVMAGYIPLKEEFFSFLTHVALPVWVLILLATAMLKRRAMFVPPFCLLLAASVGFCISYVVLRKGWPYQSYPMLALALIALAIAVVDHDPADSQSGQSSRFIARLTAVLMAVVTFFWMNIAIDRSAVAAAIREISPHPTMLALSSDISIGHPIVRQVGGIWVGRACSLWLARGAEFRLVYETLDPQTDARLKAFAKSDRLMLTEDIARHRPDVILVQLMKDTDWLAWARSDPMLAELLQSYRPYKTVGDVLILRRTGGRTGKAE
jgi:hypothetical protein